MTSSRAHKASFSLRVASFGWSTGCHFSCFLNDSSIKFLAHAIFMHIHDGHESSIVEINEITARIFYITFAKITNDKVSKRASLQRVSRSVRLKWKISAASCWLSICAFAFTSCLLLPSMRVILFNGFLLGNSISQRRFSEGKNPRRRSFSLAAAGWLTRWLARHTKRC